MPQVLSCNAAADFRSALWQTPCTCNSQIPPAIPRQKVMKNILSSATEFHKTFRSLMIFKIFTLSNVTAVGQWFEKVQRETDRYVGGISLIP